jgi:hypothetical protein
MKVMSIVAWGLVAVLLIGGGTLAFLNLQQSKRADELGNALFEVGTTAGVANLAPELLKQPAALPDILQQVKTAIQGVQQELANTKDSRTASQDEASRAKEESAKLTQSVNDQKTAVEAMTKDLAAKDTALAEAKSLAEQVALETKDAQAEADKKKAELEGIIEGLRTQMAEESARLQADVEAARQQVQALEAAAAPAEAPAAEGEMAAESGAEEEVITEEPEVAAEEPEGRIIGQSQMFSLIRYSEADQSLSLRLLDGQALSYREVPLAVYDRLVSAEDKIDMIYRFNIQGAFKSRPPDSVVVRKYWKWQRRHPGRSEVRVIEPEAPPAAEAVEAAPVEAAVEAAPVEASAEETAPAAEAEGAAPAEEIAAEAAPAEAPVVEAAPGEEPAPAPAEETAPAAEPAPAGE